MRICLFLIAIILGLLSGCHQKDIPFLSRANPVLTMPGWSYQQVFEGELGKSYRVDFANKDIGYLFEKVYGNIYTTQDGGKNWTFLKSPAQANASLASLWDVSLVGEQHIFLAIHDIRGCPNTCAPKLCLLKSADAGQSWQYVHANMDGVLSEIHFFNAYEGMGIRQTPIINGTSEAHLVRTMNGGQSWEVIPAVIKVKNLQFINQREGFALAAGGLYRTFDAGLTWSFVPLDKTNFIQDVRQVMFISTKTGYIASFSGLYKTTDGGLQWNKLWGEWTEILDFWREDEGMVIRQIESFPNDIPDANWEMLYTNDGGENWTKSKPVHNYSFSSAIFPKENAGFVLRGHKLEAFTKMP
mgnify:CR=1 FL=1